MFVLLGRDPCAPILIEVWVELRKRMGERFEKLNEAIECEESCEQWLGEHEKGVDYERALVLYDQWLRDETSSLRQFEDHRAYRALAMHAIISRSDSFQQPDAIAKEAERYADAMTTADYLHDQKETVRIAKLEELVRALVTALDVESSGSGHGELKRVAAELLEGA